MFPLGQLHLIVWGPGHGEAMVLILPDGRLGIVDGCRERDDPVSAFVRRWPEAHRVAFVCLTHPHDDHYAGLGRLIEEHIDRIDAIAVTNMMSNARWHPSLMDWIKTQAKDGEPSASIKGGLQRMINQVNSATERGIEILHVSGRSIILDGAVRVESCAPSAADEHLAQRAILARNADLRKTAKFSPNWASAALTIDWGDARLFLGGDLEAPEGSAGKARNRGWNAAARHAKSGFDVIKAAHHASHNGYHSAFWDAAEPKLIIVTPFQGANGTLPPRREDIVRLRASGLVAVSSPPKWLETPVSDAWSDSPFELTPAPVVTDNAVAVSLNNVGELQQLILAGQARLYDGYGNPESPPTRSP